MKNTDLLRAMNDIDDEFIEEAARKRASLFPSGFSFRTVASLAMVMIAVIGIMIIVPAVSTKTMGNLAPDSLTEDSYNKPVEEKNVRPSAVQTNEGMEVYVTEQQINGEETLKEYASDNGEVMYTVRKTMEDEAWNIPDYRNKATYDVNGMSVQVFSYDMNNADFALWDKDGYHYSITFAKSYAIEDALQIIATID